MICQGNANCLSQKQGSKKTNDIFHLTIPTGALDTNLSFYTDILWCKLGQSEEKKWQNFDFWGGDLILHKTDQNIGKREKRETRSWYGNSLCSTLRHSPEWGCIGQADKTYKIQKRRFAFLHVIRFCSVKRVLLWGFLIIVNWLWLSFFHVSPLQLHLLL